MKKVLGIVSAVAILAALVQLVALFSSPTTPATPQAAAQRFAGLPVDEPREVTYAVDPATFEQMTERERLNQLRDWLLYSVASSTGLGAGDLSRALFDTAPVRHAYLQNLASFEYGETRQLTLSDGGVIALLPAGAKEGARRDQLASIADSVRKDSGQIPATLHIFEYSIDQEGSAATLTRRADLPGAELFSAEMGYVEMPVGSLADFERFLSQADDLTYARLEGQQLILGGRAIADFVHREIGAEHIAAIWQSEQKIKVDQEAFEAHIQREVDRFNNSWRPRLLAAPDWRLPELERQRDAEFAILEEQLFEQQAELKVVDGSGFSLDPAYDYAGLAGWLVESRSLLDLLAEGPDAAISAEEIDEAIAGARGEDAIPFLRLLDKLERHGSILDLIFAEGLRLESQDYEYQVARYDGELQGTETGMILFYTDLLAKLWGFDYASSAPDRIISDFVPQTEQRLPPMYSEAVQQLPSTRLWFGPQHRGFQVADGGQSLSFARTAARLYAASSSPLTPGEEVAANPSSSAFLNWWDRHYKEVARHEPAYEQLNQIMKWSLLVGWLNERGRDAELAFLEQVDVRHDLWFPEWVKDQPQLRFQSWPKIGFNPPGYKGTSTETLPLLISEPYESMGGQWTLSGGVSLASRQTFREIAPLADDLLLASRRSILNYGEAGSTTLRTLDNISFEFVEVTSARAAVVARAAEQSRLTARTIELANQPVEQVITRSGAGLSFQTRVAGAGLGDLHVAPTTNGFAVGWVGRDIDFGHALSRRLLAAPDPEALLVADPSVAGFIKLGDDYDYLVRLRGSNRLLRLAPETAPAPTVSEGFLARVAAADETTPNLQLAWHEFDGALDELGLDGYLSMSLDQPTGRFALSGGIRGPPAGATKPVQIVAGGQTINARLELATGRLYFDSAEVGGVRLGTLTELPAQMTADDLAKIRAMAAESDTVSYTLPGAGGGGLGGGGGGGGAVGGSFFDDMRGKPFRTIADDIATDPVAFAARSRKALNEGLSEADALLRNGDDLQAYLLLDELERTFGKLPDIRLRKGLAKVMGNKPEEAMNLLNDMLPTGLREGDPIFKEINSRLAGSLDELERANVSRVAEFADWRNLRARKGLPVDDVRLGLADDRLVLELHLDDLPAGRPVAADDLPDDGFVYVQDSPELNNLDWDVGIHAAAQQAVAGDFGQFFALPRGGLDGFNPTRIYVGVSVKLEARGPGAGRLVRGLNAYQPGADDECSSTTPPEQCDQPVSIVTVKA